MSHSFFGWTMSDHTGTILKFGGALAAAALLGYGATRFFGKSEKEEKQERYFVGIDLGATNAKAGVVNDCGELLTSSSQALTDYSDKGVVQSLVEVASRAVQDAGLKWSDIREIGVGSPGTSDFDVTALVVCDRRMESLSRHPTSLPGIMSLWRGSLPRQQELMYRAFYAFHLGCTRQRCQRCLCSRVLGGCRQGEKQHGDDQ